MVRRHAHPEVHPRHALQRGRYRLGTGQVADDGLRAERLQLSRTLVLATDHETHRHILSTQLLEDRTAHAAGTGDKNKVAVNHQSISFGIMGISELRCDQSVSKTARAPSPLILVAISQGTPVLSVVLPGQRRSAAPKSAQSPRISPHRWAPTVWGWAVSLAAATAAPLPGRKTSTTTAPARATAAGPIAVMCMAWMKASFAGCTSARPAGPSFSAMDRVAWTDSPAACRAEAGSTPRWPSMPLRYVVDSSDPSTATPMAPPTCRKVLLTADPEPAFSRGSDDMIMTVAGGITWAIPVPIKKNSTSSSQMGVCWPSSR